MANVRESWIETSDVISMFPTLVWQASLRPSLRDAVNARILRVLDALRRDLPPLASGMGWQSEQTLHEREELGELAACVGDLARSVLRFLRSGYDAVDITGCWATVLAQGASHRAHTHPNNFLSAVYYVRAEPGAGAINFHDPRAQADVIRPPVLELTSANTDQVVVRVASGTLLMFPSYLEHSVDANPSEHERVSVSFNLMFAAFARHVSKPLW
ncbi:MAG TPA: TIGR02466 family protein [Casimicrobiaceae bacterium]